MRRKRKLSLLTLLMVGLLYWSQAGSVDAAVRMPSSYKKHTRKPQQQLYKLKQGVWELGAGSVVQLSGQGSTAAEQCQRFNVQLDQALSFDFSCVGLTKNESFDLENRTDYSVTRHGSQITITRYGYLTKKPQTSQLSQALLKIPFVKEIIHIKQKDNQLAFYYETFEEDEFGRIVQKAMLQAHSLSLKSRLVGSRASNKKRTR